MLFLNVNPQLVLTSEGELSVLGAEAERVQFPYARLALDLIEVEKIESLESLRSALEVAHDLGVAIVLDDITSGYGTLRCCLGLAPRWIKVDSAITRGIARDPEAPGGPEDADARGARYLRRAGGRRGRVRGRPERLLPGACLRGAGAFPRACPPKSPRRPRPSSPCGSPRGTRSPRSSRREANRPKPRRPFPNPPSPPRPSRIGPASRKTRRG